MGAGAKHRLVFVDRLLATLVHLRHGVTHDALACWFGVDRSTLPRAIGEVRPLLAERGCTSSPGVRLRTLAEVIDHLGRREHISDTVQAVAGLLSHQQTVDLGPRRQR
ncbi:transposase family protein [Streptomyces sp. NPDC057027]|uniref:helix-turn-helix domain-containing protein n=1 Tax=Streptomyces sp. NPDC057027 TaxID=3346004 RepID=UPI00362B61AB